MKTSTKRQPTGIDGVFYKDVTNNKDKSVDKVYGIRWRDENGKSRMKTLGKHSQGIRPQFCKVKLDEIVVKIRLGEDLPKIAKKVSTTTIDDLAAKYYEMKTNTVKDIEKEKRRYELHLEPRIGDVRLQNFTEDDAIALQTALTETLAVATVKTLMVTLNAMYKYAVKMKLYSGDIPTADIKHEQLNNVRERYLSLDEIEKLLEVCYQTDYELYLFVKLSLSTGGRVGSIHTIKVQDINLDNNSLTLSDHKNEDTYTGFYDDELKEMLAKHIDGKAPSDRVISRAKSHISYKLGSILDVLFNLGVDDSKHRVVPHTLRHTFASQLAIAGVPIFTIQKLMNHKSIEMTMRYAKLAPDQGMDAVMNLYKKKRSAKV
ncbi:Site-specific recombinase XerD [Epsilonproteobacteria bacterium SCGC AD-308-E02]|jgi:integrase|nr:Site-specific recombinase XerD [Epsilonproteobacteria bacterium SCGC AD-308-E02]